MKQSDVDCPFCEGAIPLDGDEGEGEEVYCSYCNLMLTLKKRGTRLEAVEEDEYWEE